MRDNISFIEEPNTDKQIFSLFSPLFRKWFKKRFGGFSLPQKYSILPIHSRQNILISAPTGSGKTLAAFSAILNELVDNSVKGILEDRIYCVYISPLKALNEDIKVNLLNPLSELNELHGSDLGIRVGVRTGDTPQKERTAMLKNPPHILITTPESLSILLASKKFSEHFRKISWVIIDEIHSLASNKRGVHLSLLLEFLAHYSDHLTRVGISATVAPLEQVAHFLVGNETLGTPGNDVVPRPCFIVNPLQFKNMEVRVKSATKHLLNSNFIDIERSMYRILKEEISSYRTTLIFTNTRAATEKLVHNLKHKYPILFNDANIAAHHSSLSKEERLTVEEGLRHGNYKCIVSSTSLELGIDIGSIDLVVLLGSPKGVARAVQRVGRSGHRLQSTCKGLFIVTDRDDLVECSIIGKLMKEGKIDRVHIPQNSLDVLAQQIIGFLMNEVWNEYNLFKMIKKSYCYSDLSYDDYLRILEYLAGEYGLLENRHVYGKIWRKDDNIGKKGKLARVIYMTNLGTIPQEENVIVKFNDQIIGYIEEGFLEQMNPRSVFVLSGRTYRYKHVKGNVLFVHPEIYNPPNIPHWYSNMLPLSYDTAIEIQGFRKLISEKIALYEKKNIAKDKGNVKKEIITFIKHYLYLEEDVASEIYYYFLEQAKFACIPDKDTIVVEMIDDNETKKIVFHTLYGRRVNDCLSRLIAVICSRFLHKDIEIGINDNAFSIGYHASLNIDKIISILKMQDDVYASLEEIVSKTDIIRRTFRHCASRAFMILKNYQGREKSVGRQLVSSQILYKAAREIGADFPILKEAKREVLEDKMDIINTIKVIKHIRTGKTTIKKVNTSLPSPFAFNIILQGLSDIMKADDKQSFLRRMHSYVLAKIAKTISVEDTDLLSLNDESHIEPQLLQDFILEKSNFDSFLSDDKKSFDEKLVLDDGSFDYTSYWNEKDQKTEEKRLEKTEKLRMDLQRATRKIDLLPDIRYDLFSLIDDETKKIHIKTILWLKEFLTGTIPKQWSDELVFFLREKYDSLK